MNRITFRIARLLTPEERAAALGDLAETGITGWRALREIAGLVLLRQAQLWMTWRPWFALIGVAGIAGAVLGRLLFACDVVLGTNITAYAHYQVFMNDATLAEVVWQVSWMLLLSCACSWMTAYILARASRRALWLTAPVLYLMVLDSFEAWLLYTDHARGSHNPLVMLISGALLPINFPAVVAFLLPAFLGLRRGLRCDSPNPEPSGQSPRIPLRRR